MDSKAVSKSITGIVSLLLAAVVLHSARLLLLRLYYEYSGAFSWDFPIHWTIGRSVLHGLVPYRDMFDFKPPGAVYLSAFSLWLDGSFEPMFLLHAAALALMALLPVIALLCHQRFREPLTAAPQYLLALQFGIAAALLSCSLIWGVATETFSTVFLCFYGLCVVYYDELPVRRRALLLCLTLFVAVSFRETAVPLACALALIGAKSLRNFAALFVWPLAVTFVAGLLILSVGGMLDAVWELYIKNIFILLRDGRPGEPSALRTAFDTEQFWLRTLYHDFRDFSLPYAGWILLSAIGLTLYRLQSAGSKSAAAALLLRYMIAAVLVYLVYFGGVRALAQHRSLAIAAYLTVFMLLQKEWLQGGRPLLRYSTIAVSIAFALFIYPPMPLDDHQHTLADNKATYAETKQSAEKLDAILNACGFEHYYYIGTITRRPIIPAFSTHLPLGPVFFQIAHFIDGSLPSLRKLVVRSLQQAELVVVDRGTLRERNFKERKFPIRAYLRNHFSDTAPPHCGPIPGPFPIGNRFQVLFRTSPSPKAAFSQ